MKLEYIFKNVERRPLVGFKNYGLMPGDRIKITKGSGIITHYEPDYVEVIEEMPQMILVKYVYKHWQGFLTNYKRCLNKVFLATGDIVFQKE